VRPTSIKILGKPYSIEWPKAIVHDGDEVNGLADPDAQQIQVVNGLPLETSQDKLLHEVMHCVEASMDLDLEDTVIERLATGLLAVLKDNPKFVAYLRKKK
jgi:hypothetical protein